VDIIRTTYYIHGSSIQVAQLLQRDCAAGCVSFGQQWKNETGIQYFADIFTFNQCKVIGQQSYKIR